MMQIQGFKDFHSVTRESQVNIHYSFRKAELIQKLSKYHQVTEEKMVQRLIQSLICGFSKEPYECHDLQYFEQKQEESTFITLPIRQITKIIELMSKNPEYSGKTASEHLSSILIFILTWIEQEYYDMKRLDMPDKDILMYISYRLNNFDGCHWM